MSKEASNNPIYKKGWFWALMIIVVLPCIIGLIMWIFAFKTASDIVKTATDSGLLSSTTGEVTVSGFGKTATFDELEITLGDEYVFAVLDNQFSDYNGMDVVAVPVTIKNLKSEEHKINMFYYDIYGPKGTEVKELNSYFDDSIDNAGKLKTGASYETYMCFLYDGDGQYSIVLDNYSQKVTFNFQIAKK